MKKKFSKVPTIGPQDLHKMLQVLLVSYKEIEDDGFPWDLQYMAEKLKTQMIPFIIFLKCDGAEGDKMSGQYGPKTMNVKNLCRYCVCPTTDSDKAYTDHNLKTQPMIQKLIK